MLADDVTVASFPDVNYARPQQHLEHDLEHSRTEHHQTPRYGVMTSSFTMTSFPLPQSILCSMLLSLFLHSYV